MSSRSTFAWHHGEKWRLIWFRHRKLFTDLVSSNSHQELRCYRWVYKSARVFKYARPIFGKSRYQISKQLIFSQTRKIARLSNGPNVQTDITPILYILRSPSLKRINRYDRIYENHKSSKLSGANEQIRFNVICCGIKWEYDMKFRWHVVLYYCDIYSNMREKNSFLAH
jgi:hypothetical protein